MTLGNTANIPCVNLPFEQVIHENIPYDLCNCPTLKAGLTLIQLSFEFL